MNIIKYLSALVLIAMVATSCQKEEAAPIKDTDSYESKMSVWQSHRFVAGSQTGTFTVECDILPEKDSLDGMFGLQSNVASTYSEVSSLVRFNSSSYIDVHNGEEYSVLGDTVFYTGNTSYHLRLEVDVPNLKYDVYVAPAGKSEVKVAEGNNFRNFAVFIDQWSTVSSDYNVSNPGLITVSNVEVIEKTVNKVPVVLPIGIIRSVVDTQGSLTITTVDPLNGKLTMEAIGLPSFASFEDKGNGKITISYKATLEDIGNYKFKVKATSSSASSEMEFDLYATRNNIVIADAADNNASSNDQVESDGNLQLFIGGFGTWEGGPAARDMAAILPIQLPEFTEGEIVNFARLYANLEVATPWAWQDYDLYGLPYRSSELVLATDFWQGEYGTAPNAQAIQQKLFTQASPIGKHSTSEEAGVLLAEYINKQIENGAKPGDYIFLRININVADAPDWGIHKMSSADAVEEDVKPKVEFYFGK